MIITELQSLKVVLAAEVVAEEAQFLVSYFEKFSTTTTLGSYAGATTSDTSATLLDNPATDVSRSVTNIQLFNADTADIEVTVSLNDGMDRPLFKGVVPVGCTLQWSARSGWVVASYTQVTAGGEDPQIQYNTGGNLGGLVNVEASADNLAFVANTPSTPSANRVVAFNRQIAKRNMLAMVGPAGVDTAVQPLFARNKIGTAAPTGNATTVHATGYTPFSTTGTATARTVATTNMFTRMRRVGYVSAATAGSLCGARVAVAQITLGVTIGGLPCGGFFKVIRFGTSDAATVAGARQFVGISSSTGAATNVEPSTLTNSIGVGHGASDSNLFIYYGGSAAQTPIDLGANFPANTLSADVYELALFCPPGVDSTVYYQVTRLNTGDTATGTLTAATPGTQLPSNTTLLTFNQSWRTNNATALAVGLDIFGDYIETDQ